MKRAILCLTIILAMSIGSAAVLDARESPIDKGSKLLAGGLSFSMDNINSKNHSTLLTVNPSFGVFVTKGFLIGATLYIDHFNGDFYDETTAGLGPEFRFYFNRSHSETEVRGSIYPYVRTSLLYLWINEKYEDYYYGQSSNFKSQQFNWVSGAGLDYMLSNAVGAFLDLSVNAVNYKTSGDKSWDTSSAANISIGFTFFLY